MKSALISFLCLWLATVGYSKTRSTLLVQLDSVVNNCAFYDQQKEKKIATLKNKSCSSQNDEQLYTILKNLYEEYSSYRSDSASVYAGKMLYVAQRTKIPTYILNSKIALAYSCLSAGLYKEASEIYTTMDTLALSKEEKYRLSSFYLVLQLNLSGYAAVEPYSGVYQAKALEACDATMHLTIPGSREAYSAEMTFLQLKKDYRAALQLGENRLLKTSADLHDYAIVTSTLGYLCLQLKDTTKAVEYLIESAIADVKNATKETTAMRQLAEILYQQGDLQSAYKYAMVALSDANFYNARHRKIEVGRVLPIIEAGRFTLVKQQKDRLTVFSIVLSVLCVLIALAAMIIFKQRQRIKKAREHIENQHTDLLVTHKQLEQVQDEIKRQNIDLLQVNEKLLEAHHIKEEYIGYFFSTNSAYLDKMEELRKLVVRKIRDHQYEDLAKNMSSIDARKEREELFALFDTIFLRLFPDFITRYNELFAPEDQVELKGDTLTPELRIFALVRLGIGESERIARFLDFSLSTVKNYKTKARNRSHLPNDLFETKIMEIESVKTLRKS